MAEPTVHKWPSLDTMISVVGVLVIMQIAAIFMPWAPARWALFAFGAAVWMLATLADIRSAGRLVRWSLLGLLVMSPSIIWIVRSCL